jgi:hypothetical protein
VNEQTAKLLQKASKRLRDAPDIFFRRRSVCMCVERRPGLVLGAMTKATWWVGA